MTGSHPALSRSRMLTGHNTDVRHQESVFHVQTEDKGTSNPYIETLVYVGGQVLGAKRASYADLLEKGEGDKAVVAFMEQQHRWTIKAIQSGKFDQKLKGLTAPQRVPSPAETGETEEMPEDGASAEPDFTAEVGRVEDEAAADGWEISDTFNAVADGDGPQTLDQVILDYLATEADQEQLLLMVDSDETLSLGKKTSLAIRTSSSKTGLPVTGARVALKMIATDREAETLAEGKTGQGGKVQLTADLPEMQRGTAALIIVADSTLGTAEIKHLL